jgi:hypothetical protein
MARKRMLSPEFFTSGPVAALPLTAMVTFEGLWCYCDDYGRGEDNADLIKAAVWPRRPTHTTRKVAADLDAITTLGLVCRYQSAGVRLIHVPSWNEHQKISHRTESKLPPCPNHEAALYSFFLTESGGALERFRNGSGTARESVRNETGRTLE